MDNVYKNYADSVRESIMGIGAGTIRRIDGDLYQFTGEKWIPLKE